MKYEGALQRCTSVQSFWNLNFALFDNNYLEFFIKGLLKGMGHNYGVIKSIRIFDSLGAADFLSTLLDYQQKGVTVLNEVKRCSILCLVREEQLPLKSLFVIPLLSNLKKLSLGTQLCFSNNVKFYLDPFELLQHTQLCSLWTFLTVSSCSSLQILSIKYPKYIILLDQF